MDQNGKPVGPIIILADEGAAWEYLRAQKRIHHEVRILDGRKVYAVSKEDQVLRPKRWRRWERFLSQL
ncbi:hypothetical protein [Gorillibacterium sp. sgz5001074]|uniref:hypothetical protein n=1 Tax=Gorillibacterium sp. sgz5001074 TaxID=3446695 RepID=UPI003F66A24B